MTKKIMIVLISLLVAFIILFGFTKYPKRVKKEEITNYVIENQNLLSEYIHGMYKEQKESFKIYDNYFEFLINKDSVSICKKLRIEEIVIYKGLYDDEDCVKIRMNYKPQSTDYYACGIYYSPQNITIDYYGTRQAGDIYEYDGMPKGTKIRYKSEKICDYWYYYEEAVWN